MSVWADVCYQMDTFAVLLRSCLPSDLHHPVMEKFCTYNYVENPCVGSQLPEGDLLYNIWATPSLVKKIEPKAFSKPLINANLMLDYLNDGEVYVGIEAVYKFMGKVLDKKVRWKNEWDWKWLDMYVSRMLRLNQYASYQSKRSADEWIKHWRSDSDWRQRMQGFDNMAETMLHITHAFNAASHRQLEREAIDTAVLPPRLSRRLVDLGKDWAARRFGGLTIITFLHPDTEDYTHYVLTQRDIKRISQMCSSLADMELYFGSYYFENPSSQIYTGYRNVLHLIHESLSLTVRPNELARACDVASALLLSHHATDVWEQSVADQSAKITKEDLNPVLNVSHLCSIFMQYPLAEAVELSKVYKFLPVPDFDWITMLNEQRTKHFDTRPCFQENDLGLTEADFDLYQRHQMIITYHAKHHMCPGKVKEGVELDGWRQFYPHIEPTAIPYTETHDIDYTGSFDYSEITQDDNPYIKDKALAPNFLSRYKDEVDYRSESPSERNYLLHYLFNTPVSTPRQVLMYCPEERYELGHHTSPKGETKKPVPRIFFINTYSGRVAVSEIDNNIAEYIKHKPGCFSGLTRAEAFNKFEEMSGKEMEHVEHEYVYVSFDLAGWSPKQSPLLRQKQLRKWSEAFGRPYLYNADDQFSNANAHFIHKGIHQVYPLQGNDLEGYFARLNTELHVDVMGYAVRQLRNRGFIESGAKLAVQIDDGLCVLRFQKGTPNTRIIQAIKIIEDVYKWFSLEISWDKTYVSKTLRVFLNELDYGAIRITPGVKAFLRIRREKTDLIRCFLRETNKAAGLITGAIEAGCEPILAWLKYALEVGKAIQDWTRRKPQTMTPEEAALWSFIPVSYGGIGMLSILQYTSNTSDASTPSGLSILKSIATYDPVTRPYINRFLNQPIRQRGPISIMRDPLKFRVQAPCFSDLLEIPFAKRALRGRVKFLPVLEALEFSDKLEEDILKLPLPNPDGTHGTAYILAYESSLLSVIDGILMKFARSGTIIQLIGSRDAFLIYLRYRRQFNDCYNNALKLLRHI